MNSICTIETNDFYEEAQRENIPFYKVINTVWKLHLVGQLDRGTITQGDPQADIQQSI